MAKFAKIQYLVDQKALVDVIEKSPVGIFITNKKYICEYVNPAYCRLYGYESDELEGEWRVVDEHGRPKKNTFVPDISDRKEAERALELESSRRRELLGNLQTRVVVPLYSIAQEMADSSEGIEERIRDIIGILEELTESDR